MESPQGEPQLLPGLEPAADPPSDLELAARRTIAQLADDDLIDERHALTCQLLLELSRSVAAAARTGKASAAAMAAAQILAALDTLMPTETGKEEGDAFDELASELREAALSNRAPGAPTQ